ncbi:hypothetical protein ACFV0R_26940 [Streptomyces sp. NPDC059578]|uniref:hypothetical protein n=1 Tax=Streptomyces sp. NPDC059578 TaxID=3346874 RepID=UPI003676DC16
MPLNGSGGPRRLFVIAGVGVGLAATVLGRHATRPVHPDCVLGHSRLTDGTGRSLPEADGRVPTHEELVDHAVRAARESGHCAPPRPRWRHWLD